MALINCEIEHDLFRTKNRVLSEQKKIKTDVNFAITSAKIYASVVTLPINYIIKFLENIKQGFKRTISCNKHRSKVTTQSENNDLYYLIDPTFRNINRLLLVTFKNGNNDPTRNSFEKCYMPLVESKSFNVLNDNKPFFISK